MASSVEWSGSQDFARAPLQDLLIGGVPTGKFKSVGGLTWVQVENAGHMVPINNPAAASFAIGTLIRGSGAADFVSSQSMSVLERAFDEDGPRGLLPRLRGRGVGSGRARD